MHSPTRRDVNFNSFLLNSLTPHLHTAAPLVQRDAHEFLGEFFSSVEEAERVIATAAAAAAATTTTTTATTTTTTLYSPTATVEARVAGDRLRLILCSLMWRNSKSDPSVERQLLVPPRGESKHALSFTDVERHFYERQVRRAREEGFKVENVWTSSSSSTTSSSCLSLDSEGNNNNNNSSNNNNNGVDDDNGSLVESSLPLLRLRQACDHPQIGSFGISTSAAKGRRRRRKRRRRGGNASAASLSSSLSSSLERGVRGVADTGVLTLSEVRTQLLSEWKTKCEEHNREAVAAAK